MFLRFLGDPLPGVDAADDARVEDVVGVGAAEAAAAGAAVEGGADDATAPDEAGVDAEEAAGPVCWEEGFFDGVAAA